MWSSAQPATVRSEQISSVSVMNSSGQRADLVHYREVNKVECHEVVARSPLCSRQEVPGRHRLKSIPASGKNTKIMALGMEGACSLVLRKLTDMKNCLDQP